jgi:hypothetical protein
MEAEPLSHSAPVGAPLAAPSSTDPAEEPPLLDPLPLLLGVAAVAGFLQLKGKVGFTAEMAKGFIYTGFSEAFFFLAYLLLLLPGMLALGWGCRGLVARLTARIGPRLAGLERRHLLIGALAAGFWLVAARFLRWALLDDLPVTDDEMGVLFAARMWLEGHVTAPAFQSAWGLRLLYVVPVEGGHMTSWDFPGGILAVTLSLLTGLGSWLFAALAALSGWALAHACRRLDSSWGFWLALVVWTASPMVWSLSLTEHAHLVSRSLIAFAWALLIAWVARVDSSKACPQARPAHNACPQARSANPVGWRAPLLGLCAALAVFTRPAEALLALAPIGLYLVWRAWNARAWRDVALAALAALLGPILLLAYNASTTGSPWVMPRFLSNAWAPQAVAAESWWSRVGENLGFNLMMVLIYFVGPVLVPLVAAALSTGKPLAKVAFAAVLLQFGLALLHSNTGVHVVGPIHYSEAAVPLLVLVALGARPLADALGRIGLGGARALAFGVAILGALLVFGWVHSSTLLDQAGINRAPIAATADLPRSIVLAEHYPRLWRRRAGFWQTGSSVIEYPFPDPYLRERVLFADPRKADVAVLRRDFPDREIFVLRFAEEGPPFQLERLAP